MEKKNYSYIFMLFVLAVSICSGCVAGPAYTGSEDIGKLRGELDSLRAEYSNLQQDYSRLIEQNKRYADYYRGTTDAIATGLGELTSIGGTMEEQIRNLRTNNRILIGIVQQLVGARVAAESGDSQTDTKQSP